VGYFRDFANEMDIWWRRLNALNGHWNSRDMIGFAGGDANFLRFVGNNPVIRVDPSGTLCSVPNMLAFLLSYAPLPPTPTTKVCSALRIEGQIDLEPGWLKRLNVFLKPKASGTVRASLVARVRGETKTCKKACGCGFGLERATNLQAYGQFEVSRTIPCIVPPPLIEFEGLINALFTCSVRGKVAGGVFAKRQEEACNRCCKVTGGGQAQFALAYRMETAHKWGGCTAFVEGEIGVEGQRGFESDSCTGKNVWTGKLCFYVRITGAINCVGVRASGILFEENNCSISI